MEKLDHHALCKWDLAISIVMQKKITMLVDVEFNKNVFQSDDICQINYCLLKQTCDPTIVGATLFPGIMTVLIQSGTHRFSTGFPLPSSFSCKCEHDTELLMLSGGVYVLTFFFFETSICPSWRRYLEKE